VIMFIEPSSVPLISRPGGPRGAPATNYPKVFSNSAGTAFNWEQEVSDLGIGPTPPLPYPDVDAANHNHCSTRNASGIPSKVFYVDY
jgi:hypothetical protein